MPHANSRRLINIGLRGITLCSKFVFVFFLAKFLPPRDVGLYGLLAATVGYGIYLVGLEFYTFSGRELMACAQHRQPFILKNQLTVYLGWYGGACAVLALLAHWQVLPEGYLWWILALLVCEHLAQELNRILIALSMQLVAGVVLFVRLGLWSLAVVVLQWQVPETRNLGFVLCAWLVGSASACALALFKIKHLLVLLPAEKLDVSWIRLGLRVALPLFVASLAIRGLATFDRFFIENAAGLEVLAAYVIFAGVASAILALIDAGVVDFAMPKLVAAARGGDSGLFRTQMARVRTTILAIGLVLVTCCALGGWLFVDLLGRPVYSANLYLLYWVLGFTAINVISLVPHLGLYALGKDRAIVLSQVCGFGVFLLLYVACRPLGAVGVLAALCAAWSCILFWKTAAYRHAVSKFAN